MTQRSRVVLPYLVPELTRPPVNTRALAFISRVAGDALSRHLNRILPALLRAVAPKIGTEAEAQELAYCQEVLLAITDDEGVRYVVSELLRSLSPEELRSAAILLLCGYCEQTKAELVE